MVRFPTPLYHLGRFVFGLLGSAITMGMILIALDASPVNKKILGAMDYKYKPFYGLRLDKEVLAYFQHATGLHLHPLGQPDPFKEFGNVPRLRPQGRLAASAPRRPGRIPRARTSSPTRPPRLPRLPRAPRSPGAAPAAGGNVANPPGMPGGIAPPGGLR